MNYFDDLDKDAITAFCELDGTSSFNATASTHLSSEMNDLIQSTKQKKPEPNQQVKRKSCSMDYLFKLISPITPTTLASAAILPSQPSIVYGESQDGVAQFCQVNETDIPIIRHWLAKTYPTLNPVFAPINTARKAFSPFSAYPTLGLDTTLPHHRPQSTSVRSNFFPTQDQYPVWYFFYGTLADRSLLARLFCESPETIPELVPAVVYGGKIRTWGGKYKALVNNQGSRLDGWAYEVLSRDHEDSLRVYETAKYEVVRVDISLDESSCGRRVVQGCTFRFNGDEHELD